MVLALGRGRAAGDRLLASRRGFDEGDVAQVLHVGPYADERPSLERLNAGIAQAGFRHRGRHHELYLGDPRKSTSERLRTILRQPIER
jgi:hypothetical protein